MNIRELITELEVLAAEHGDDVCVCARDIEGDYNGVEHVKLDSYRHAGTTKPMILLTP